MAKPRSQGDKAAIRADKLRELARTVNDVKDKVEVVREPEKAAYDAAKDEGFHMGAFKNACKLMRWEVTDAQDYIRAFNEYVDILGLRDQADMFDNPGASRLAGVGPLN